MQPIPYFKLQAKNLFKDYKTKTPAFDKSTGKVLYKYASKYFDMDRLVSAFDINEENFTLMKAQHIIAYLGGCNKWTELAKASYVELELAKLLFDNQHKISIEDWFMYIAMAEDRNKIIFDAKGRLEIFKKIFEDVESHHNDSGDFRLNPRTSLNKNKLEKYFDPQKLERAFEKFMDRDYGLNNEWLKSRKVEVYARRTKYDKSRLAKMGFPNTPYFSECESLNLFDFANIKIPEKARRQGCGKFILFLFEKMAKRYKYDGVLVEQVFNPVVIPYLLKQGYTQLSGDYHRCFFKITATS